MIKNNFDELHYPKDIKDILEKNVDEKMVTHIRRANDSFLDTISQTFFGIEISYKEMFENIEKYAKALKGYGIGKGDCVTLAMPNIPETIYYIYACNLIGAIAYPIDPRSTLKNMIDCITNSNSKLFVCEMGTYYSKVAKYLDKLPVENVVVVSPLNILNNVKVKNSKLIMSQYLLYLKRFYEDMKLSFKNTSKQYSQKDMLKWGLGYTGIVESKYEPDIPAIIVNTSGTTGNFVKGAMHSNRTYNLYANEAQFVTRHLTRGNTYYGYIPYFTMYGSGVGMHVALNYGVIIDNIPKFNGKKSLQEIIDKKSNILIGTPTIIEKLLELYEMEDKDASHVKQYIVGGDNVSPEKLQEQNEKLIARGMQSKLVYGYGATECMPVSTTNYDEDSYVYGSAGMVYPMAYIKILDSDTLEELDYGKEGEIFVHNPTLMLGYLNNPEETNKVMVKIGDKIYYRTGDKGYLVESGNLFITGRYKRMMKRPDGHQVSPIPIENSIMKDPLVKDCAVVGITRKNGRPGVVPTAFIELQNDDYNIQEIIKIISENSLQNLSGERESALAYVIVDKIPYTINGKTDFSKLQNNYFEQLDFYVIDDVVTREYFEGMENIKFVKINKTMTRSLNKK